LRTIRSQRNKDDVERAKQEYNSDEYAEIFSYRKGGRKYIMKREQDIAHCYRKLNKISVYWEDEDEESALEEEIDLE
jgi:hypothetical protein